MGCGQTRVEPNQPISNPPKRKPFLSDEERQEFEGYDPHFENLVFEGGGSVGIAHIGATKVLEELGYLKNIKRFAGSSAGALIATSLAVGYSPDEIEEDMKRDLEPIVDGCCCSLLVNLIGRFGANPGRDIEESIANSINRKTGDKDYTFKQLYQKEGVELCILGTDLSKMDTVYFHVKTTPDMPIYLAGRASSSLPVLLEPVKWKGSLLVDGGVLCNYPVHAYDGWYLSMEEGDQFLKRFSDFAKAIEGWTTAERFGTFNENTLGVMLYGDADQVLMKDHMEKRTEKYNGQVKRPDTELSRKRNEQQVENTVEKITAALGRLHTVLDLADQDRNGTVSRQEFRDIFTSRNRPGDGLTQEDTKLLFETVQSTKNADAIFDRIDTHTNNNIEYNEIEGLALRRGVDLAQIRRGYGSLNIGGIKEFVAALLETLMLHAQRVTAKSSDSSRTIGINVGYLGTLDWTMEKDDKDFLIERGKHAALCFLREHKENSTQRCSGEASGSHQAPPSRTTSLDCSLQNQPTTN